MYGRDHNPSIPNLSQLISADPSRDDQYIIEDDESKRTSSHGQHFRGKKNGTRSGS